MNRLLSIFVLLLFIPDSAFSDVPDQPIGLAKLRGERAVVFLIDKSGSMKKDNKIKIIREALVAISDKFKADDVVSLVGFDSKIFDLYRPKNFTLEAKELFIKRVDLLYPNGRSDLISGLSYVLERFKKLQQVKTKQLILVSDHFFTDENTPIDPYIEMARVKIKELSQHNIKISIISMQPSEHSQALKEFANAGLYDSVDNYETMQNSLLEIIQK